MRKDWNASRNSSVAKRKARSGLESVFRDMEYLQRKEKEIVPKEQISGIKNLFLEEYYKNKYFSAKKCVNDKFGREIYTDEILLSWLGIEQPRKIIFDASKEGIENAYKKAEEINEKIGDIVIKKETVDLWIKEEQEKENNKQRKNRDRDEDDYAK